ncbi:ATPase [Niabella ginsenosidivorans]|uniref:ATPase n=1 Tax=Niabella ginsenosidivorans TaxID=1176587 RepID=A0A1A9I9H1_9BACT|nr:helicase HerA-like domain-containing protein [Niabella ginsenosidivorans]ANH83370.1 ATPase [Niabella ginsenosidivorans]
MQNTNDFLKTIQDGYSFKGENYKIGRAMLNGQIVADADVFIPFKTLNRHGLIAGATGTGKTKTLQLLAEGMSDAGIPVVLMDIKGDLSGIGAAGTANDKITERCQLLGIDFKPEAYPIEFLTLSNEKGTRLRATVSEFGPVLLSKILELNDTQGGFVAMIFKYCDDNKLPLLDLKDFIKVLQYVSDEGKAELEKTYGKVSTTSTGTILRKVIELQQQGADLFFGERSFDVEDLMRVNDDGRGMVSIIRVTDLQDRPKLFSTFMLQMLAELYASLPEVGDPDKPKLVLFIDEAHLIFNEASSALLNQLETIVKLIRSKGVGVFLCTQNPMDVPASILAQLGLKVQHALRAFTAADRKVIKQTAENYPISAFYKTEDLLTQVGIGEALITLLNEKGIPTPLAHCMLRAPQSRMDILTDAEIDAIVARSKIAAHYNEVIDNESAYELLSRKLDDAAERNQQPTQSTTSRTAKEEGFFDNPIVKSMARTAGNTIVRSLLGAIGLGGTRKKSKSWF